MILDYIKTVFRHIKQKIKDFFVGVLEKIKIVFLKYQWIITTEWGKEEWIFLSFCVGIASLIAFFIGRLSL